MQLHLFIKAEQALIKELRHRLRQGIVGIIGVEVVKLDPTATTTSLAAKAGALAVAAAILSASHHLRETGCVIVFS